MAEAFCAYNFSFGCHMNLLSIFNTVTGPSS